MPRGKTTGNENHTTRKELRLLHLNCQGYGTARADIDLLLHEQQPDVVSLQETLRTWPFNHRGYTAHHLLKSENPSRRGTTVLIRNDITTERLADLPPDYPPESITLDLHLPNQRPLRIISMYVNQNSFPTNFLRRELNDKPYTIVMGDLNARCASSGEIHPNFNGNRLDDLYDENLVFNTNTGQPTRTDQRDGTNTQIDYILGTNSTFQKLSNLTVLEPVMSDHLPILATFQITKYIIPENYQPKPRFDAANWESFKKDISTRMSTAPKITIEKTAIDKAIRHLTENIQRADKDNIPKTKRDNRRPPLPPEIITQIKTRKELMKQHKRTKNRAIKTQINKLTKTINQNIKEYKENTINNAWNNQPNKKPNDFWTTVRKLMNNSTYTTATPLHQNGNIYKTTEERLECFHDLYKDIFSEPLPKPGYEEFNRTVENYVRNLAAEPNNITEFNTKIKAEDILIANKRTKNTAPGTDGIYYSHIKNLPINALEYLAEIYETSITTNYFPDLWKQGTTILLPKPNKDHKDPKNYRPITLLPALGKTMERIVNNRMKTHLEKHNKLNQNQSGYRAGRSTTDAITNLLQTATVAMAKGSTTLAAFYDVEKAFDKVWHAGLIYKLGKTTNLSTGLTKLMKSFLTNRTTRFRLEGTHSETLKLPAGTPQGSILSPTLFILYVNDIPATPNSQNGGQEQYADDLTAYRHSKQLYQAKRKLQPHHNKIEKWSDKWRSAFNAVKTKLLPIQKRKRFIDPGEVNLIVKGERVEASDEVTNLGVKMDTQLKMHHHFKYVLKRAKQRVNRLKAVAGTIDNPRAPPEITLKVYNSMVRPIMEYAPTACIMFTDKQFETLENLRIKAHKIAYGTPLWTNNKLTKDHMDNNTPKVRIENLCIKYINSDKRTTRMKRLIKTAKDNYPYTTSRTSIKDTPLAKTYAAKIARQENNN